MPDTIHTEAHALLLSVLIDARRSAGVTQAELAQRLGWPQQSVSYLERGVRRLDVVEFYALARALDRDPADLFAQVLDRFRTTFDTDATLLSPRARPSKRPARGA